MSATALLVGWLAAGALAVAAATLAERACAALRLPRRLPWALALAVLLAWPVGLWRARAADAAADRAAVVVAPVAGIAAPRAPRVGGAPSAAGRLAVGPDRSEVAPPSRLALVGDRVRVALRDASTDALRSITGAVETHVVGPVVAMIGEAVGVRWGERLPRALGGAWALVTLALLARLVGEARALRRMVRRWRPAHLAGADVLVTTDVGPAVVGVVRPRIVVPAWTLDLPADDAALVVAHEREHLRARDPWLLAAALGVAALLPWHPAAWVAVRRLRLAVEADCDRRVLRAAPRTAGRVRRYGALLLDVAERTARGASRPPRVQAAVALLDPPRVLDARVRALVAAPATGPTRVAAVVALGTALGGLAAACAAPAAPAERARRGAAPDAGAPATRATTTRVDWPAGIEQALDLTPALRRGAFAMLQQNEPDAVRALVRAVAPAALDGGAGRRPAVGFLFGADGTLQATAFGDDRGVVRDVAGWRALMARTGGRDDAPLPEIVRDGFRGPLVTTESVADFFPMLRPHELDSFGLTVLPTTQGDTLAVVWGRVAGPVGRAVGVAAAAVGDARSVTLAARARETASDETARALAVARAEQARAVRAQESARREQARAIAATFAGRARALETQLRGLRTEVAVLGAPAGLREQAASVEEMARLLAAQVVDVADDRQARAIRAQLDAVARDARTLRAEAERSRVPASAARAASGRLQAEASRAASRVDSLAAVGTRGAGTVVAPTLVRVRELRGGGRDRDLVVWTTGGARVGVRGGALAPRPDSLRVRSLDGLTADVGTGDVHVRADGGAPVDIDAEVTGGSASRFGGRGQHLVLLRGGRGILTRD